MKLIVIQGRKHCEKRRNCLLQAISPFLAMFSIAIYLKCVKMRHCVVMGQQALNCFFFFIKNHFVEYQSIHTISPSNRLSSLKIYKKKKEIRSGLFSLITTVTITCFIDPFGKAFENKTSLELAKSAGKQQTVSFQHRLNI